jgi:hypothetical protein
MATTSLTPYTGGIQKTENKGTGWGDGMAGFLSNLIDTATFGLTDFAGNDPTYSYTPMSTAGIGMGGNAAANNFINSYGLGTGVSVGNGMSIDDMFKLSAIERMNLSNQAIADQKNSFWGRNADTFSGLANIGQGIGSLANIYQGMQMMDMYEEQLGMAKEKWAITKDELNRIRKTRDKINTSYMA